MEQFESLADGLLVRAPAKINLWLLIAGKRPDGFHELKTVMAKIDWYDEVLIQPGIRPGVELVCRGPQWAPRDQSNLVHRAAQEIFRASDKAPEVRLTLVKNVPAGSGLGSASSDAAATLLGLNTYLDLDLPRAQLARMACELGSDVAFFLNGPLALCTGRGEAIQPLTCCSDFAVLLVLPAINVSTKEVYAHYTHDPLDFQRLNRHLDACVRHNELDLTAPIRANMLQGTCFHLFKELNTLKEALESLEVGPVCLSGSGSAMFVVVDDHDDRRLEELRERIAKKTGCRCLVASKNRW